VNLLPSLAGCRAKPAARPVRTCSGDRGAERPHGGPRVSQKELATLGREAPCDTRDDDVLAIALARDLQGVQGAQHVANVVRVEQVLHARGALGQRREEQHAVAQRLGARQLHHAVDLLDRPQLQRLDVFARG